MSCVRRAWRRMFGSVQMRVLLLGLDSAGKTSQRAEMCSKGRDAREGGGELHSAPQLMMCASYRASALCALGLCSVSDALLPHGHEGEDRTDDWYVHALLAYAPYA
jgi:hypothetical protein